LHPVAAVATLLTMDRWKFFDITHRDHVVCNPTSLAKLDEVIGLLDLPEGPRVLDIACGKGEWLFRLAARYGRDTGGEGFRAVGVDISPYHIAEARAAAARRAPAAELELLEAGGADYRPAAASFDLVSCLGASWIFGGHRGTLRALRAAVKPGGRVLVGEPFWRSEPDPAYLDWSGMRRADFGSHLENVDAGLQEGLHPLLALVSNGDEWDRYETLQWRAAARHAAANPTDPDVPELLERVSRSRHEYLAWGRETLGWALYLFARGTDEAPRAPGSGRHGLDDGPREAGDP
jgi:SAM-dependent methyltransferase